MFEVRRSDGWYLARILRICSGLVVVACLLLALRPVTSLAVERLVVDPEDSPLEITGWVGEDSFSAPLRLIEKSGQSTEISYVPSDLRGEERRLIPRDHVTVEGPTSIPGGAITDLKVRVTDVKQPGTYRGELKFVLPGQHLLDALGVGIVLIAKQHAALTQEPGTKTAQLQVVNCHVACVLSGLVPDAVGSDQVLLIFHNETRQAITVLDASVFVADGSGRTLSDAQVHLPPGPITLPARAKIEIPLTIRSSSIPAGHYTGSYSLVLEDGKEVVTGSLELSVRREPIWAFLLLIVGMFLGRQAKKAQERTTGVLAGVPAGPVAPVGAPMDADGPGNLAPRPSRWKRFVQWLSGVSIEATKRGRRILIWAGTLALILAIGFINSYLKGGATFGSNWPLDVVTFIGFGLSAEVVGATLSSLPSIKQ